MQSQRCSPPGPCPEAEATLTPALSSDSPQAPGSGQHSDSHGESSAELEEQDLSGPRTAQCPAQVPNRGGTYSPGRAPRPTLGCSDPSVPQAPAGGGSEETVTKVKQSRSEKKARKVGWGPAGTLPPPGGTRLASNPSTQDWGWLR